MAGRESAEKKPGSFTSEEDRPKRDGELDARAVLELLNAEPVVPTLVIRGKAGADIVDESRPNELPALDEEMETPPRVRGVLPGEVVDWALIAARRGPSEVVWAWSAAGIPMMRSAKT
jgi:hypothetical protein